MMETALESKSYDKIPVSISSPAYEKGNLNTTRRFCKYVLNRGAVPFAPRLFFSQFWGISDFLRQEKGRLQRSPRRGFRQKTPTHKKDDFLSLEIMPILCGFNTSVRGRLS